MAAPSRPRVLSKDLSDEDYWSSSNAVKIKARGNLFDDSVNLDAAKRLLKEPLFDDNDDDDLDMINWDGSVAAQNRTSLPSSVRYQPNKPTPKPTQPAHNRPGAYTDPEEKSIDDIVGGNRPRVATLTEISKLESQVNSLKRMLDAARNDRFTKVPVTDTVKRIMYGQAYSLEMYKSKEDKLALLDEAIKLHDGNAVIAAVLFLKSSIKAQVFNLELMQRPAAIQHYICYLRQSERWQDLMDLFGMLGRSEDAAMLKYKQAVSIKNAPTKIKNLQNCHRTHFQCEPSLSHEAGLIQEQISMLERQQPIDVNDTAAQEKGDAKFRMLPRVAVITDQPVITTLYYCCLYHYHLPENNLASPLAIKKLHKLTDKQYLWTALNARAKLKQWPDIEGLFQSKGWFGGTKMKSVISFDKVVQLLHKLDSPKDILNKYCMLIEDQDRRLETAEKYGCQTSIIETLKAQRDRQRLEQYYNSLKPHSQEWFYAQDVLRTTTIKWKN